MGSHRITRKLQLFSGAYAYIEASFPRVRGDVARLLTRTISSVSTTCLTFFYHMMAYKSYHMGTFNVYIEEDARKTLLFSKTGPVGSHWNRQSLTLRPKKEYKVRGETYTLCPHISKAVNHKCWRPHTTLEKS